MLHTEKKLEKPVHFIILVPHRDALKIFDEYREKLFAAAFAGAYSFPSAAPLAIVSRPLKKEELKTLAANLRGVIKKSDGKISGRGTAVIQDFNLKKEHLNLFGLALDLSVKKEHFPETARDVIIEEVLRPVLCAALAASSEVPFLMENTVEAPALSFSAAALANLAIRPLGSGVPAYSFEWKIGALVWLPKK